MINIYINNNNNNNNNNDNNDEDLEQTRELEYYENNTCVKD